ncbi:MAG TPA: VanZ family protein [Gaiellaceae bacterium]|nr:VanZ family protein [Gaiellaceae bacterium]
MPDLAQGEQPQLGQRAPEAGALEPSPSGPMSETAGPGVRHRLLVLWLPVVAWAALIFALSSIPDLGTGLGGWDLGLRKIAHAAEYAILGALLVRATGRAGFAFALGVLYAISDEVHQSFVPGRMGSPVDVAIDALGVAIGVAVWQSVRARRLA